VQVSTLASRSAPRAKSERTHVHEEQGHRSRDRCRPGQGRYVEPSRPEQPFTGGFPSGFTVRPNSRRHAERRCDRAHHDNRSHPRRVALRASRLFAPNPANSKTNQDTDASAIPASAAFFGRAARNPESAVVLGITTHNDTHAWTRPNRPSRSRARTRHRSQTGPGVHRRDPGRHGVRDVRPAPFSQ
jgi:hypothetical protein